MRDSDTRQSRPLSNVVLSIIAVVLAASTATGVAAQSAPTGDAAWAYLRSLPADQQAAVMEREAKREGKFVMYGALGIDRANILLDLFRKRYPGIETDFVRMRTSEVVEKALIEQRTGRINSDLLISGVDQLGLLSPALAPYEPTTWQDLDPRFREGGFEQGWTAITYELLPTTIAWRTDRVSPADVPKTLDDVANPKWKGRTGTHVSTEKFIEAMVVKYGEKDGMAKVEALAAIDPRLYQSTAALSQALASGEIDLAWEFQAHRPFGLKAKGAPVDYVLQEPLFGLGVIIAVVKGAQHPYAAALFMDFLTSAEVLETLDKLEGGRIFGNTKGDYSTRLADVPDLTIYRPLDKERYRELNQIAEQLFLRK